MYLSKKQIAALDLALEAMESYTNASYSTEQNEAINTIVEMLESARQERVRRRSRKETRNAR